MRVGRPWCGAVPGLVALFLLSAAEGAAGGLRDFEDGWLASESTLRSYASGRDRGAGFWVSAGRARLYEMPELPLSTLGIGHLARSGLFSAHWQRLGGAICCEDRWRLKLARGRRQQLGISFGGDRLRIVDDPVRRKTAAALTVKLAFGEEILLDAWAHLCERPSWHGARGQRRLLRITGRFKTYLWTALVERNGAGEPSVQLEALLRPVVGVCAGLRIEPATGTVVLVTVWTRRGLLLRSSHAVHPELGLTHRWSAGWLIPGGRP